MKYALVATPQYLLCVDLISKVTIPIEHARGEYYGISWFPDSEDLTLSHSALDNNTLIDISSYAQSEIGYISSGSQQSKPFLSQPHQILCTEDSKVICTNTGRNVISVIDLKKPGLYHEAGVSNARWDRLSLELKTGDHLNSVFLKNNILYVMCHRFDKGASLACFAYPSLELMSLKKLNGLSGLHNIWVTDEGQYLSCHSESGSLVDLASNELLWDSGCPIYTRGLAASDEYLILGESQKTGRELRNSSLTALWILEQGSWKTMDYIALGPYGCVNEVRLLDVPDIAHHGHLFQGIDKLLQRNIYQAKAHHAIEQSRLAQNASKSWNNYQLIFGTPIISDDGAKHAAEDDLCLVMQFQQRDSFAFDYDLESPSLNAHVSAVLGYQGGIEDRNMHAILLHKTQQMAVLSFWHHDNSTWRLLPGISITKLPMAGTMEIKVLAKEIVVFIQRKEILRLNIAKYELTHCCSNFGIRWIGAKVKPIA